MPEITSTIVEAIVTEYKKDAANIAVLAILRQVRQKLAEFWLNTPDEELQNTYLGDIGNAHKIISDSGIKYEPLTDSEKTFVNELETQIALGFEQPKALQYLLAAWMYRRADQLPLKYQNAPIARWIFPDLIKFMLDWPSYFQELGEVEKYYNYMNEFVSFIYTYIVNNNSQFWQEIALLFSNHANLVSLYFCQQNLRDIYTKRSDIMELSLRKIGNQIDYVFPEKPADRKKIRLGILKTGFMSGPETFVCFPNFEHLDREKFEIILYVLHITNNSLEKYATSRVDAIVKLPKELPQQVQRIRDDNLDILFVGTILSNAIHRTLLLSIHRLGKIQVTYFASPVTTGIRNIDYFISGKLTEPWPNPQNHYREKLINIDGPGFCFSYPETYQTTINTSREILKIPENAIAFISGANIYKIIPEVRETWAKIIAAVPNSVLILMPFGPSWGSSYPGVPFTNKMQEIFSKYGVNSKQLIIVESLPNRADVKEVLKLADIYLNAYPYSGSTSIIDPLEVGVPPVVMDGNSLRSRMGAALLRDLEITDLIANNEAEYIQLSINLAKNSQLRQEYREKILEKMANNPRFLDSRYYSAQIQDVFEKLAAGNISVF